MRTGNFVAKVNKDQVETTSRTVARILRNASITVVQIINIYVWEL